MKRTTGLLVGWVLLLAVVASNTVTAQCAMCRQALTSPEGQLVVAALRRGIVVLLLAPFLLFGVVAFLAVRTQRRARNQVEGS